MVITVWGNSNSNTSKINRSNIVLMPLINGRYQHGISVCNVWKPTLSCRFRRLLATLYLTFLYPLRCGGVYVWLLYGYYSFSYSSLTTSIFKNFTAFPISLLCRCCKPEGFIFGLSYLHDSLKCGILLNG